MISHIRWLPEYVLPFVYSETCEQRPEQRMVLEQIPVTNTSYLASYTSQPRPPLNRGYCLWGKTITLQRPVHQGWSLLRGFTVTVCTAVHPAFSRWKFPYSYLIPIPHCTSPVASGLNGESSNSWIALCYFLVLSDCMCVIVSLLFVQYTPGSNTFSKICVMCDIYPPAMN